jgi:predicted RNA-binding Zn-ribbon protein involved in translation (DUF1610 family)
MYSIINLGMTTVILEKKFDYQNRLFALCESCYWTATFFTKIESYECPVCQSRDIALTPLSRDEKYDYKYELKRGLQINFSINEEIRI